ncbi:uncharacterized protein G2W53_023207 [Senna tora]|uniref:Uncharacterized protein n=1 Tax=Senna tora TaxID=362788 RepID=A0A834T9U0_9FABA|nr:uncharacterized protein G2W53_023207 [Senna tora]
MYRTMLSHLTWIGDAKTLTDDTATVDDNDVEEANAMEALGGKIAGDTTFVDARQHRYGGRDSHTISECSQDPHAVGEWVVEI